MFEYILLMKIKLLIKKLEDSEVTAAGYISTADEVQRKYSKSIQLGSTLPSFTPPPPQLTPTSPPTTKATNPLSRLPNFASVFQFNNRVSALEKDVAELKKNDPFNTQVTALVDEHLDSRLGATRDEFMSYLSASIITRITKQVNIQLPQILPKEVSNFAPPVIKSMVTESLKHAVLAKESSQPQSTYEAASSLTEFELKKILIDKMDASQSYLTTAEHRECYDGLIKSYDLDKSLFSTYDKVYLLKRSRKYKNKDEDPSAGSDRGLKKRKTSKDAEPTKDSDMPQDQEKNLGNDDAEPERKVASKHEWFTKPKQPKEPTNPDWNIGSAFKLLKGTRNNFAELEYDFEECYKALFNWEKLPEEDQLDNQGRNRLMRLDELYKFSDGTLTRLRTSLDDITKNIRIEYLPQRRWSTLEKKRAHIMIKAIDKQLKERRMMRSLEKFVGGRHYGTDLWLLQ
ncbi:hypothetical protein Tco_0364094 [Tanacetum coccineum]